MKTQCVAVVWGLVCVAMAAAQAPRAGLSLERLHAADRNRDGSLSQDELGESLWKRLAGFDTDGDGKLDTRELAALADVKGAASKDERRPGGANASFTIREHKASNGHTLRYSLFVPTDAPKKLPVVLCLHGAGGNTAAANVLAGAALQKKHPCIIVAPACDGRGTRWVESTFRKSDKQRACTVELMETLDAVVRDTGADPSRIYVTGQSMGGVGTWGLLAAHPTKFAAAVPVCGIWEAADAAKLAKVPVWAFHGAKDPTVPVEGTRRMIDGMKAAGGTPKYTEFPNVGHGSWDAAYATEGLWEWMFAQKRTVP